MKKQRKIKKKLSKNYIDTIAGQWKRLNVETVEEAMKISEKEHKKLKKAFENKKKKGRSYRNHQNLPWLTVISLTVDSLEIKIKP